MKRKHQPYAFLFGWHYNTCLWGRCIRSRTRSCTWCLWASCSSHSIGLQHMSCLSRQYSHLIGNNVSAPEPHLGRRKTMNPHVWDDGNKAKNFVPRMTCLANGSSLHDFMVCFDSNVKYDIIQHSRKYTFALCPFPTLTDRYKIHTTHQRIEHLLFFRWFRRHSVMYSKVLVLIIQASINPSVISRSNKKRLQYAPEKLEDWFVYNWPRNHRSDRSLRSLKGNVKRSGLLKESLTSHEPECRWITVGSGTLDQLMNESFRQYGGWTDEQPVVRSLWLV